MWLSAKAPAELANISERMGRKALNSREWRGADLNVREVEIGRGGDGGKALQVHVDSLPPDLREDWYLARGITLHERPDLVIGQTILVPEQSFERNAQHDKAFATARWRLDVIRPVMRLHPNGKTKKATRRTLEYWVRDYEADAEGAQRQGCGAHCGRASMGLGLCRPYQRQGSQPDRRCVGALHPLTLGLKAKAQMNACAALLIMVGQNRVVRPYGSGASVR